MITAANGWYFCLLCYTYYDLVDKRSVFWVHLNERGGSNLGYSQQLFVHLDVDSGFSHKLVDNDETQETSVFLLMMLFQVYACLG